jgi:transglutaminase-like putative cysteine protease
MSRPRLSVLSTWILLTLTIAAPSAFADDVQSHMFTLQYEIIPQGEKPREVTLTVVIPRTVLGRQKIHALHYSQGPARVWDDEGTRYARFDFKELRAQTTLTIRIEADLYRRDLASVKKTKDAGASAAPLPNYLAAEKYIDRDAASIARAAAEVRGGDTIETLHNTMKFVRNHLKYSSYDPDRPSPGAREALAQGKGVCQEFSDLFVALCRANRIHARVCEGYTSGKFVGTPKHCWVEVHLEGMGWVPFEPTQLGSVGVTFEERQNRYLYLSWKRNDSVIDGGHFWRFHYQGEKVEVKDSFSAEARSPR